MTAPFFALLLFGTWLSSAPVFADPGESPFSDVSVHNLRTKPEVFLRPTTDTCASMRPRLHAIRRGVERLTAAYRRGDAKKGFENSFRTSILPLVNAEDATISEVCRDFVRRYYTALALDATFDERNVAFCSQSTTSQECLLGVRSAHAKRLTRENTTEIATSEDLIFTAALHLLKYGKIRFLDSSLRPKLAQELGPSWNQEKRGRQQVLGAYQCSEKEIYLDSTLSPIDLGATVLHEMEHLYRDAFLKTSYEDDRQVLQTHVRDDELVATAVTGFAQWQTLRFMEGKFKNILGRLAEVYGISSIWNRSDDGFDNFWDFSGYFPASDLSFISPRGTLGKLFHAEIRSNLKTLMSDTFLLGRQSGDELPREIYGQWHFGSTRRSTGKISAADAIKKVRQKVEQTYGFSDVLEFSTGKPVTFSPLLERMFRETNVYRRDDLRVRVLGSEDPQETFVAHLAVLRAFITSPSPSDNCQQEMRILRSAEKRSDGAGGGDGRQGKDGTRVNGSGRQGKDGVRTQDPDRLGKDGTRVESPLRPCLHGTGKL